MRFVTKGECDKRGERADALRGGELLAQHAMHVLCRSNAGGREHRQEGTSHHGDDSRRANL